MYYRICDKCGAYLDPGERCDCQDNEDSSPVLQLREKEKAAPVLQHQSGKVERE